MAANKIYSRIVKEVSRQEGLLHQVSVGDVREIVSIIAFLIATDEEAHQELLRLGKPRVKKQKKSK